MYDPVSTSLSFILPHIGVYHLAATTVQFTHYVIFIVHDMCCRLDCLNIPPYCVNC